MKKPLAQSCPKFGGNGA